MPLGEFEQADVLFRRAVERAPDDPSVHLNYARFLLGQERFSQALVHLRRSAELRPGVAQTDLMTAAALVGDEQFEAGHDILRRLLEAHPDWRAARIEMAKYYERVDRLEDALDTIAEFSDEYADVLVLRCEWLIRQGRIREAGAKLDEALALHPQISTLYDMAASLKKLEPGDPLIARMEDLLDGQDTQRKPDRAALHFALGKT